MEGVEGGSFFWQSDLAWAVRYLGDAPDYNSVALCTVTCGHDSGRWLNVIHAWSHRPLPYYILGVPANGDGL